MNRRSGFSLVELLVVVGIIALLAAILVPTVGRAKVLAREMACRSNLSQLSKAYYNYCTTWGGRTQPYVVPLTFDTFWMELLSKYHSNMAEVRNCPVVKTRTGGWGTTFAAWGPSSGGFIGHHWGSYAINGWIYDMGWDGVHHTGQDESDFESITVARPGEVPAFADSSWVDAWPREYDLPVDILIGSQYGESSMGRVCIRRHDMAINVGFVGGSARKVPLDDLWSLEWHEDWQPRHDIHVPDPYGQ